LSGDTDGASQSIDELMGFAFDLRGSEYLRVAESGQARLALLQNDTRSALAWARSGSIQCESAEMMFWICEPLVTKTHIRIVSGNEKDIRAGIDSLSALKPSLKSLHRTRQLIEIEILCAFGLARLSWGDEAIEALHGAVSLAMPGGWVRPFVELGSPMAEWLLKLDCEGEEQDFVQKILGSFAASIQDDAPVEFEHVNSALVSKLSVDSKSVSAPFADLTNREIDILELLALRLQNKEIAARLHISAHTVGYHLKHIYEKLGVSTRRHAVTKAIAVGLLFEPAIARSQKRSLR